MHTPGNTPTGTENDNPKEPTNKSQTAQHEEAVLSFWKERGIFEKSIEKNESGGDFVFYDGPPFATGLPHYGHMLPGTIKDVVPRYQTMRGVRVIRKWGWDCHGLPIENLVEKELSLNSRKEILDYGIEQFNEQCRRKVLMYKDQWEEIIPRTGRWVDMQDHYKTMDPQYTESAWWAFKELDKKGLVYQGYKPMHLCPRCETTLSNNEVADGYADVTDLSVTVRFRMTDPEYAGEVTYMLAWTTTPWTLPGNTALAVGPDVTYAKVRLIREGHEEFYIMAKARIHDVMAHAGFKDYEIVADIASGFLVGKTYQAPYDYYQGNTSIEDHASGWKVYEADFITDDAGTGIAHQAPAFGADDYHMAKKEGIPIIHHVGTDGRFVDAVAGFDNALVKAKDDHMSTDILIIKDLAAKGLLFSKEKIVHSYPHCWRCDTPLLNYATSSWFIKSTELRARMLAENSDINWVPDHLGHKRFHNWIENNVDWAVSRSRFWGAPLPIWKNQATGEHVVIGSLAELKDKTRSKNNFVFIRHGEAISNVEGVVCSTPGVARDELTEKGIEQAQKAIPEVERLFKSEAVNERNFDSSTVDVIVHSPFRRAKQTAQVLSQGFEGVELIEDERIRERGFGSYDGKSYEEYNAARDAIDPNNDFAFAFEGGETMQEVKDRMMQFMYDMDKRYEGKNILVVTHFSPYWLTFAGVEGMNDDQAIEMRKNWGTVHNAKPRVLDFADFPHNEHYELDYHRPYIDQVTWIEKGHRYEVIGDVFDCWYESGSMPYASKHYGPNSRHISSAPLSLESSLGGEPTSDSRDSSSRTALQNSTLGVQKAEGYSSSEGKEFVYPADFICEAIDQTRGWFYSLLALGVGVFDQAPMKNVIVTGHVMAEDGKKMSKKLQNYPDLDVVFNKYGADALRYFLLSSPVMRGEKVNLTERDIDEVVKKIIMRLKNVVSFLEMYRTEQPQEMDVYASENILDQWVLARLNQTIETTTQYLDSYELDRACQPFMDLVDDVSTWYLRRSRDRFKTDDEDAAYAQATTTHVVREMSKLFAPFMPFMAEHVWQAVRSESDTESVHLEHWPRIGRYNGSVLSMMKEVRTQVSTALDLRVKSGMKVRQPLASVTISSQLFGQVRSKVEQEEVALVNGSELDQIKQIIAEELNVKEVIIGDGNTEPVLDLELTDELKQEGDFRELLRLIQQMRKAASMNPSDMATLTIDIDQYGRVVLENYFTDLERVAGITKLQFADTVDAPEQKANGIMFRAVIQ